MPAGESLETLEKIENEFGEWAGTFVVNMESKVVERQKSDILLKESEINLSRRWKHVYDYALGTLRQMLTAYNEKSETKIEFLLPDLPSNLFGGEAESYKGIIVFDRSTAWGITLQIVRPYRREEIPNIVIAFYRSHSNDENAKQLALKGSSGSFLILAADPKEERIQTMTSSQNMHLGDIETYYSIKSVDYKSAIKKLLTTLIEYQLISLVPQGTAK